MDSIWSYFCSWRRTWSCCYSVLYVCAHVHRVGLSILSLLFVDSTAFSSHLPLMFGGMEHIMLSNHPLADEALNAANAMCDGDPLLLNERGLMAYNRGEWVRLGMIWFVVHGCSYGGAAALFQEALDLAQVTQTSRKSWSTTYINLGTCYRKLRWVVAK